MTTKLYKVEFYLIDPNAEWRKQDIQIEIANKFDMITDKVEVAEADIGEWYDEHPLNYLNCPKSEFEKYFE